LTLDRLYRFVQFEYPWPLGPADGRYLVRDHAGEDAHHVLVLAAHATTTGRRGRRWGREPPASSAPAETGLTRATVVDTAAVDDEAGRRWLEAATAGSGRDAAVAEGLRWLNFALRAHRAAAADPGVHDVTAEQALVVRLGYGAGFEVADGAWSAAREVGDRRGAPARPSRRDALRPQERLAALLAGRDAVLACEEMVLRARIDLAGARPREAALQAHLAVEAAVAELAAFRAEPAVAERLPAVHAAREPLAAAANEALQGGPSEATMAAVEAGLRAVEAALRARASSARY
jgi:hypothetical protein